VVSGQVMHQFIETTSILSHRAHLLQFVKEAKMVLKTSLTKLSANSSSKILPNRKTQMCFRGFYQERAPSIKYMASQFTQVSGCMEQTWK
jgi:hypothetical protein